MTVWCAFCKQRLYWGEIYVHDKCTAEYDRRKAAGKCIGCGVRNSVARGWCAVCHDQVYVDYPGRK